MDDLAFYFAVSLPAIVCYMFIGASAQKVRQSKFNMASLLKH